MGTTANLVPVFFLFLAEIKQIQSWSAVDSHTPAAASVNAFLDPVLRHGGMDSLNFPPIFDLKKQSAFEIFSVALPI